MRRCNASCTLCAGFDGSADVWVEDVLNLGFGPIKAIDLVRLSLTSAVHLQLPSHQCSGRDPSSPALPHTGVIFATDAAEPTA